MVIKVISILKSDNVINSSCTFHGYCLYLDNTQLQELMLNTYSKTVRRYVRWQKFIFIIYCYTWNSRYI